MSAAQIELRDGAFSFGEEAIFSGLNLDVAAGEVFCILGPNGCGKTTILRCLSGALVLKRGEIRLCGKDLSSYSATERAKHIGFVFQEHAAVFPYSVLDVVTMGRTPYLGLFSSPSEKDRELAELALSRVDMLRIKDKPYTEISGGQRQLILIARTLVQEPDVILLDEPTSHLDFKNQALCLEMVSKLAKEGISMVMTTHNPNQVLLFADRVAMMSGGAFIATGDAREAITEESLEATYGIEVRVFNIPDPKKGGSLKLVSPGRGR
jgi:iron complex transport system ATP-binding protein